jgi:hypothetical protein
MTWEQLSLFTDEELGLQGPKEISKTVACYWCQGTGLLQSDEECPCFTNTCECKNCKQ